MLNSNFVNKLDKNAPFICTLLTVLHGNRCHILSNGKEACFMERTGMLLQLVKDRF